MHNLTTSFYQTGLDTSLNKTGLGSLNQTGLGTTMISSKNGSRELLNTNTSSIPRLSKKIDQSKDLDYKKFCHIINYNL